jgi:hypothetical protein
MKLTKSQLKQIIKEELSLVLEDRKDQRRAEHIRGIQKKLPNLKNEFERAKEACFVATREGEYGDTSVCDLRDHLRLKIKTLEKQLEQYTQAAVSRLQARDPKDAAPVGQLARGPGRFNEANGGVLPFPGRDGDTHKMYAADDELRELGDKISEMVVLSRQVEELMLDMGMRYGELAALGTNARVAKKLIKELENIFHQKLDDIERFNK